MIKTILIFCDITGTIYCGNKNTIDDYLDLQQIINDISTESNCKILFSLASSDNAEYVSKTINELSKFLPKINENPHFFSGGYIVDNNIVITNITSKAYQIVNYINQMGKICDIAEIIIIDDCEFNHEMVKSFINEQCYNDRLKCLIPIKKVGLLEVNELLKNRNNQPKQYIIKYKES